MFKIGINNKNLVKYSPIKSSCKFDNWLDFVKSCKIRSGGKIENFNPYEYQLKLVDLMNQCNVAICKSRQLGISELICSYFLFHAVSNPGYLGLIVSKSQRDSSLLARRIKRMIEGFDGEIKTKTDNIGDIEIEGGGRILFGNSNPEFYRGIESINHVFLDEFGFIEDIVNIRNAIKPAQLMLGENAREFVVSTPNGKNNEFFRLLNSGNKGISLMDEINCVLKSGKYKYWIDSDGWCKFLISWHSHPIYGNKKDFLNNIKNSQKLTDDIINQEYNLSFLDGVKSYFSYQSIKNVCILNRQNTVDGDYYFGIDASNFGGDFSVCSIFKHDENGFKMVDYYRKNNQSSEYHLAKINDLISEYNPKCVAIEVTGGTGQVWLESLSMNNFTTKFKPIKTTEESKKYMLNRVKYLLESGQLLLLNDRILTDEFLNFGSDLKAFSGKHDDLMMSICFAILGV